MGHLLNATSDNAEAWGLPRVLDFFSDHRNTSDQVYESEWFFIKDRLREGMSLLDVGSALGGFVDCRRAPRQFPLHRRRY